MRLNPEELYLDQVTYINKKVEMLVHNLLKNSKIQPIIILQGDHGHGFIFHPMHNRIIPGTTEEDIKFLKSQFKIFNAYYLPGGGEKHLYSSISPVNSFRVILNTYFDEHFKLLPDQSYYSNYAMPNNFIDVTDRIRD
ncbi:hypothetical protein HQ584_03765 [Patescibacteria group bacterium]|nr:hypothetical protein [Patescibacteria group bacterium]